MPKIKCNGEKMVTGFKKDDIGELINSLHTIERAIREVEKQLGIKEAPLPMLDLEGNFHKTEKKGE